MFGFLHVERAYNFFSDLSCSAKIGLEQTNSLSISTSCFNRELSLNTTWRFISNSVKVTLRLSALANKASLSEGIHWKFKAYAAVSKPIKTKQSNRVRVRLWDVAR